MPSAPITPARSSLLTQIQAVEASLNEDATSLAVSRITGSYGRRIDRHSYKALLAVALAAELSRLGSPANPEDPLYQALASLQTALPPYPRPRAI